MAKRADEAGFHPMGSERKKLQKTRKAPIDKTARKMKLKIQYT